MPKTNQVRLTFLSIILITIISILIVTPNVPNWVPQSQFFSKFKPHLGLDLQGGAHLVYQADFSNVDVNDKTSSLDGVRDVIERRVNTFGVAEPLVQVSGEDRIVVELAGVFNVKDAIERIGDTPLLEFKEEGSSTYTSEEIQKIEQENSAQQKLAEEILDKAKNGENFEDLAREYSEDTGSKDNGGIIDFITRDSLDPAYGDVIFDKLSNGQTYDQLVESQFGWHIIKKLDERGEGDNKEVKSQHILFFKKDTSSKAEWVNTQLSGKQLKTANVSFDQTTGAAEVSIEFNDEGKDLFAEITGRNIGKPVAIFLDGSPISIPKVNEKISQGSAVISGNFTLPEAKQLAQRLNAGALPVPIKLISQQTVGATLGKESLDKSLNAGLIGILILTLFMIIYYRLPGLLATIALGIYALIIMSIFEAWPVTLTLSGIAGFILSIGMAVDANVLIFERMKEEVRNGQELAPAIETGFKRAWSSIRDSNFSSLITCFILTYFGSSMIKGFAITLAIGIFVSMFSAIVITKNFLRIAVSGKINKSLWLFGINKKSINQTK
ncbi:MAG: protein translocase subunit SecD [Patescibacteria group bacterium]|nr:protein translocase subunit SecD [Patescibacteria group bacterium]MDD4304870.1 protein translocase subunit SecD [Patescibacteria group bacterium]MDD4695776.1 protein translocase subunit SecD [Patescibacteria group bacterium]